MIKLNQLESNMNQFSTNVQSNSLKNEIMVVTIVKDNNSLNNQIKHNNKNNNHSMIKIK